MQVASTSTRRTTVLQRPGIFQPAIKAVLRSAANTPRKQVSVPVIGERRALVTLSVSFPAVVPMMNFVSPPVRVGAGFIAQAFVPTSDPAAPLKNAFEVCNDKNSAQLPC